jgi:hypothetical protein
VHRSLPPSTADTTKCIEFTKPAASTPLLLSHMQRYLYANQKMLRPILRMLGEAGLPRAFAYVKLLDSHPNERSN